MSVAYNVDPDQLVAKYRGDPQALMQAVMSGQIDPTAAVLAGMQIKAAQNQQAMQAGNPPTVAQDTFAPPQALQQGQPPQGGMQPQGGMPSAPPVGGLGATPPAAATGMTPPQPPMPPEAPPMGMADGGMVPPYMSGGLDGIPVPDTMFDENRNGGFDDGYAGGGLIAFAGGGGTYDAFSRAIPQQESSGNYRARNKQSGALGKYQLMPATAKAIAARLGMAYDPALLVSDSPEARAYQDALGTSAMKEAWDYGKGDPSLAATYYHAGPNKKGWGPKTRDYSGDILGRMGADDPNALPTRKIETPQGQLESTRDFIGAAQDLYAELPDAGLGRLKEYYERELDPEERRKQRKEDMWMSLAQLGANMAATDSPYFLQSVGKALAETLPGVSASKKERKDAERDALKALTDIYGFERKEAKEAYGLGVDMQRAAAAQQTAAEERAARAAESAANRGLEQERINIAREELKIRAEAAKAKGIDVDAAVFQMFMSGDPAMKKAAEEYLGARYNRGTAAAVDLDGDGVPDDMGGGAKPAAGPWSQYQQ